jgi:hypothetical protein
MNAFQYGVGYPLRLTVKMKDLNPVFVKDFISKPTTRTVLLLTLHLRSVRRRCSGKHVCERYESRAKFRVLHVLKLHDSKIICIFIVARCLWLRIRLLILVFGILD